MEDPKISANGRGRVFPGDKFDLSGFKNLDKGEMIGTIVSDDVAKTSEYFDQEDEEGEFKYWLWFSVDGYPGKDDGYINAWAWAVFQNKGGIETFRISGSSGTDVSQPKMQKSDCSHQKTKEVFIGIGGSGGRINVCEMCKQEV